jgi:uncharacterized RDD family membrane protein YckC
MLVAPPLRRRLACLLYEGVLLFGVVMAAGLLYAAVTKQRHALVGQRGLQLWLFVVIGAYFVGFWVRHGQTLAMRTWRVRLVDAAGGRVSPLRAGCRYLLAWLWFLPALMTLHVSRLQGGFVFTVVLLAGLLTYAAVALLHPQRQFLHDALCGTRLVDAGQTTLAG